MNIRICGLAPAAILLVLAACSTPDTSREERAPSSDREQTAAAIAPAPTFVNRVWRVVESSGAEPGALRVFLSDGTLVMASSTSRPSLGAWARDDEGLTITEEGIDYPADILRLEDDAFHIRINGPGEPVVLEFERADRQGVGP